MRRALSLLAVALLFAAAGFAMHALALPDPPPPLAIEDPRTGDVLLWPGSAEPAGEEPAPPAPPEMRVTPCVVGPQTYPIVNPENEA